MKLMLGMLGLVGLALTATAESKTLPLHFGESQSLSEQWDDRPTPEHLFDAGAAASCTTSFGYVDEDGFAVAGESWTFDHGHEDPFEGWTFQQHQSVPDLFRRITADVWTNGDLANGNVPTENSVSPPLLSGEGSLWVGAFENEANDRCWSSGLGYGNRSDQRIQSPVHDYDGTSEIEISFEYFNDTEVDFDFSRLYVQTFPSGRETELFQLSGAVGLAPDHPSSSPVGASFSTTYDDFQGDTQFRLLFEMTSDGGWSDEDGQFTTEYGPFGADNVVIENSGASGDLTVTYDFETDLQGWLPAPSVGTLERVGRVSDYMLENLCDCDLEENVLAFHTEDQTHPYGQWLDATTPPVDIENDVTDACLGTGELTMFADWTQYSYLPRASGVFYRPGWNYYPKLCEVTGEENWSGRVGQTVYFFTDGEPGCENFRDNATEHGVPQSAEQLRFVYEVFASCDGFSIPPEVCTGTTNFSPVIDNVRIRFTRIPSAPPISYEPGTRYQDGFSQSLTLDVNVPGNADVVYDVSSGSSSVLGDSLVVQGPLPSPGLEFDTRLWFRVAKKGPGANTIGYELWQNLVQQDGGLDLVDGITDIESGEFATAKMDSCQIGPNARGDRFHSYFIEEDNRFDVGSGEISEQNEIIADGVLLPGTQIEYFVTSNYLSSPNEFFLLPDTAGGFFSEFEILPSWEFDGDTYRFPCLLYVDAYNSGAQVYVEGALSALGLAHDRYDYLDASSNWNAPLFRSLDGTSNNGAPLFQLLGYRGILVQTGSLGRALDSQDFVGMSDWLTAPLGEGDGSRRGLIMNGDNIAQILDESGAALLEGPLGASLTAPSYRDWSAAGDDGYCVRLEAPSGGAGGYGTINSGGAYEYDAWGNGCPNEFTFDVLHPAGSGVGNRAYVNVSNGEETEYNQVVNESDSGTYRTVIDGVSWHHMSERAATLECLADSAHITQATLEEIRSALEWIFGLSTLPTLCEPFEFDPANVPGPGSDFPVAHTQLFQNSPNPFHPLTTLRFSLAKDGPVQLVIFDVSGRQVRILANQSYGAGTHEIPWDGTDEFGQELAAGVYWSQLSATGLRSNKKMVRLSR